MEITTVFPVGKTPACRFAWEFLEKEGIRVVDHPSPEVSHLLLDAPSFDATGQLRFGGEIGAVLEMLPETVTVIGGKLVHPALDGYKTLDLLQEEGYLCKNAAITAECALEVAAPLLSTTFRDCPVLVLGWGRIGKCLGRILKDLGAQVHIAARKEQDRGMLAALGYNAVDFPGAEALLPDIRLLFNTVPRKVIETADCSCVQIDLASVPGLEGKNMVWARGLPGVHAPESAGRLMADTILKNLREETV